MCVFAGEKGFRPMERKAKQEKQKMTKNPHVSATTLWALGKNRTTATIEAVPLIGGKTRMVARVRVDDYTAVLEFMLDLGFPKTLAEIDRAFKAAFKGYATAYDKVKYAEENAGDYDTLGDALYFGEEFGRMIGEIDGTINPKAEAKQEVAVAA